MPFRDADYDPETIGYDWCVQAAWQEARAALTNAPAEAARAMMASTILAAVATASAIQCAKNLARQYDTPDAWRRGEINANLSPPLRLAVVSPSLPDEGRGKLERLTWGRERLPAEPGVNRSGACREEALLRGRGSGSRLCRPATGAWQPFGSGVSFKGRSRPRSYERCDGSAADAGSGTKGSLTS